MSNIRSIVLVSENTAGVFPLEPSTLSSKELNKSINRIRTNLIDFEHGTQHEPTLYFLHMFYLLSTQPAENINDVSFQADALATLQKMIYLYRYHVPTSKAILGFAKELNKQTESFRSPPLGDTQYTPGLFSNPIGKQTKAFGIENANDAKVPQDALLKKALEIKDDVLSNISICMDPFCILTALDDKAMQKYHVAIMQMLNSVPNLVHDTNKITWACFACDGLGLSVLRLQNIFNTIQQTGKKMPDIEIVLIDKRYKQAIEEITGENPFNFTSLEERIRHQITLGALKQFLEFISAAAPQGISVTVCVANSVESYINYCDSKKGHNLGSCFLQCDDIWEDNKSCTLHSSNGAVKDLNTLQDYFSQHAKNGKYVLVSKNDFESKATLKMGDFKHGSHSSQTTLQSTTFKRPSS